MTFVSSSDGERLGEGGGRLPSLDGLRAVAIGLVLLAHFSVDGSLLRGVSARFDLGNLGVRIFFVLSGFLITSLLLAEHAREGRIDLPRFFLRRSLRIMPAYVVYVVAMIAAAAAGAVVLTGRDIVHALTYTTNYIVPSWVMGHTWSLAVEEQFYLVWPLLLAFAGLRRGFRGALLVLVLAPAARLAGTLVPDWPDHPRYAFEAVCDALATGCLLAHLRGSAWAWSPYRRLLSGFRGLVPIAILTLAAAGARWPVLHAAVGASLLNLAIAVGLDACLRFPSGVTGRVLNARPVAFIGTLSYSLYLWQQPFAAMRGAWEVAALPLAFGAAFASYAFVERPALRLRARLETLRAPLPAVEAGSR